MSRYSELQIAFDQEGKAFKDYKKNCEEFINRFRQQLASYLDCDEKLVRWCQFAEEEQKRPFQEKREIEVHLGRRMILYDDASFGFAIRIVTHAQQSTTTRVTFAPDQGVDLLFSIKQVNDCFVIGHGEKTIEITETGSDQFAELVETVFAETKEYLETHFENFIRGRRRKLGFLSRH